MKTVTSEDNLSAYFLGRASKGSPQLADINKLNHKVKSIKSALKLAQRHNQELHHKIKTMKQNHQLQVMHIESEARKYRQMHDILAQNYELRGLELKQYRKRIKKIQIQQAQTAGTQLSLDQAQETSREYRQTILKQERQIGKLKQQGKILYEQLYEKSARIKQLEQYLSKSAGKNDHKDKAFLNNLRTALESKNQEFEKIVAEKGLLSSARNLLERQNSELSFRLAKLTAELQFQKKTSVEARDKLQRQDRQFVKVSDELRTTKQRLKQLLHFSLQLQKDFQQEIQGIGRELSRARS